MAQKVEKRARTRCYRIVSKVTGSWLPLWSYGCKVCIHPPLTDEPRIALKVDDLVNVTRWRKHWLFGEKTNIETSNGVKNGSNHKNGKISEAEKLTRVRGWFPRKAAVEFFEDNDYSDEEEINEQKKIK